MKNRIKEILKERGMSQKELCSLVGMSEAGLSNAINGTATLPTIAKVAAALGVDPKDLLVDDELVARFSAEKTPLMLGDIALPCYVLNNGMRVFSGRGIQKAIGASQNTSGSWLQKFVNSDAIVWNILPGVLDKFNTPVKFKRRDAGGSQSVTYGYEATLLIDLCSAIIDAFESRHFQMSEVYYKAARVIIKAVAKTGIIALVDEATGYDKEKDKARRSLQEYLSSFINQEASTWVKTFPDEFFEDIYKMRKWTWEKASAKPSFVGKIINDTVYERIAPLIYEELKKRNPKLGTGNRRYKFHQFLTSDIGKPKLQTHLVVLHTLAVASGYNWGRFMFLLDKSCPKKYQQLALFDDYEEE